MNKAIGFILVIFLALSTWGTVLAAPASPFSDVPTTHWAYGAVKDLARAGIIEGYSDGAFRGDRVMTRFEMAIIVGNAMTKIDKADAANRALIEKLSREFSAEIGALSEKVASLETRVTAVERSKPIYTFTNETLLQYCIDNLPSNRPKIRGNDAMQWRERIYLHGDVNPSTSFDARIATSIGNFGNKTASASGGNDLYVDRAYITSKNVLGFDQIIYGRQNLTWGQAFLGYKSGYNDGVTFVKKFSDAVDLKMGAYIVSQEPAATGTFSGDSQELQFLALGVKVDDNLKFIGSVYNNNQFQKASTSAFNYGYNKTTGYTLGFAEKMGKWTLAGEYADASLTNPVNAANGAKAYGIQITNGTNAPNQFYPSQRFVVDYKKPGTDAFAVSYRKVEKGAFPNGFGFSNGTAQISPLYKLNANAVGSIDNLKGFYYLYQNVLSKGLVMSLEYQSLKFVDTGIPFDNTYKLSFQVVF